MTKLWTGEGDDGTTGLLFGGRVAKDSARPTAYGAVDEAQAVIGMARAEVERDGELDEVLILLASDLWVLMAELATASENRRKLTPGKTLVTAEMVERLEAITDDVGSRFDPPTQFVVPGQDRCSAALDLARTVVRRAERAAVALERDEPADDGHAVAYLNRLSSVLWTLARWVEGEPLTARAARGPA